MKYRIMEQAKPHISKNYRIEYRKCWLLHWQVLAYANTIEDAKTKIYENERNLYIEGHPVFEFDTKVDTIDPKVWRRRNESYG